MYIHIFISIYYVSICKHIHTVAYVFIVPKWCLKRENLYDSWRCCIVIPHITPDIIPIIPMYHIIPIKWCLKKKNLYDSWRCCIVRRVSLSHWKWRVIATISAHVLTAIKKTLHFFINKNDMVSQWSAHTHFFLTKKRWGIATISAHVLTVMKKWFFFWKKWCGIATISAHVLTVMKKWFFFLKKMMRYRNDRRTHAHSDLQQKWHDTHDMTAICNRHDMVLQQSVHTIYYVTV